MKRSTTTLWSVLSFALMVWTAMPAAAAPACGLNNGKPAAGEPILIGSINGITGPDDFGSSARAVDAYFKCVNANGGINGRPIRYLILDDQWRPDVARQVATKLVRDDKVVAMIGSHSIIECQTNGQLYERENVMVLGIGVAQECFTSKNIVSLNQGPRLSGVGMLRYAAEHLGTKKATCLGLNAAAVINWLCGGLAEWGKKYGVSIENVLIDPSSLDFTSAMLQAAAAQPDTILVILPKGALIQALAVAEEQDMAAKFKFISAASAYVVGLPKTIGKYWDGRFWTELEFTPLMGTGPDNRNWHEIMDAYGDKSDPRDTFSQGGYLAAKIATEAMLKLDPGKVDRESVSAALRAVRGVRSDLLCGPWYVGDGKRHNPNHSGMVALAHSADWESKSECFEIDDPALSDIIADEKAGGN